MKLAFKKPAKSNPATQAGYEIIDFGRMSNLKWPGAVSAKHMIDEGDTTSETIEDAVRHINDFYVRTNSSAKTRCIDGRHDAELVETQLGPQVPGGAPGAALAYRLGVDRDDLMRGTFLADAQYMMETFKRLGFPLGGHRDSESSHSDKAGCGAIDSLDTVLSVMTDPKLVDDHKRVVRTLLGNSFNRDDYLQVMGAAVLVNGRADEYFKDREEIIDIMEKQFQKSVATLDGTHKECIVIVNMVADTTLSSNRFSEAYGGMQAFGYDLWRSLEMAQRFLPRDDQAEDRRRFIMARVMCSIATLMALTDGSQRLLLRVPK